MQLKKAIVRRHNGCPVYLFKDDSLCVWETATYICKSSGYANTRKNVLRMYNRFKGYFEKLNKSITINRRNFIEPNKEINIKKNKGSLGLLERAYLRNILFITNTKYQEVAKKLGLSNAMVTRVLRGQRNYDKIVKYIYNLEQNDPAIADIFN